MNCCNDYSECTEGADCPARPDKPVARVRAGGPPPQFPPGHNPPLRSPGRGLEMAHELLLWLGAAVALSLIAAVLGLLAGLVISVAVRGAA